MESSQPIVLGLVLLGGVALGACGSGEAPPPADAPAQETPAAQSEPPMATAPDTTGAAIWAHLQEEGYAQGWSLWPGTDRAYDGQAGMHSPDMQLQHTTYMNSVALAAFNAGATELPAGSIVVKENWMGGQLMAVTTMYKAGAGYNGDFNDWFFTKHLPSGDLDTTPTGMAMEGRLPGCQNCHMAKATNDFLYTSELGSPKSN